VPTKITAPEFTSEGICDILKACRKLNVRSLEFGGNKIEFYQDNVLDIPATLDAPSVSEPLIQIPDGSVYNNPHDGMPLQTQPIDAPELRRMIEESDLMMHNPAAWEQMQIDRAMGNGHSTQEQPRTNDSPAYKAFDAQRRGDI